MSQHLSNASIKAEVTRSKPYRQRGGPQYQQDSVANKQPDKRLGLHETPASGSIDDLTINIMDL